MSNHYERYRRGLIERHLCKNGRFNQSVLLCQAKPDANVSLPTRNTKEIKVDGTSVDYIGVPVVLDGKVVGGGDNPLLSGGQLMAMFAIEDMLGVSKYSIDYAELLLSYFENSQKEPGQLFRRRNWWRNISEVSKDELSGMLLGLDLYLEALKKRGDRPAEQKRVEDLLRNVGKHLQKTEYAHTQKWLFQFPFTRLFKFNLGESLMAKTFPNLVGTGSKVADYLICFLQKITFINYWYKPRHIYRHATRLLSIIYQVASVFNLPRKFYNVSMFCHTAQMIFNKPTNTKTKYKMWKAFRSLLSYFARPGCRSGQGEGALNGYLGVVGHAFARSVDSDFMDELGPRMYGPTLNPEGLWAPELPIFCLDGSEKFEPYYEGAKNRLWGERHTWEHRDPKGHYLQFTWEKTQNSIGPSHIGDLSKIHYVDQPKGFIIETSGLGLPLVQILAAYYGLGPKPVIENDETFSVFPLNGPTV